MEGFLYCSKDGVYRFSDQTIEFIISEHLRIAEYELVKGTISSAIHLINLNKFCHLKQFRSVKHANLEEKVASLTLECFEKISKSSMNKSNIRNILNSLLEYYLKGLKQKPNLTLEQQKMLWQGVDLKNDKNYEFTKLHLFNLI
jgi:hypothetical protein